MNMKMSNFVYYVHYFFIIPYFLFFIFPFSNGTTTNSKAYKVCKNHLYSCGSSIQNLGYPFWSNDRNRPDYCGGGKEFNITCWDSREQSHICISSTPIYGLEVGGINTSSQTIKLHTKYTACEFLDKEKEFNVMPPFKLGPGVQLLNLFAGCNSSNPEYKHLKSFNCTSSLGDTNTVNYINKPGQVMPRFCKSNFSIPVPEQLLQEFYQANGTLEVDSLLKEGFELTYTHKNLSACLACQKSGGICGSSGEPNWEFLCYNLADHNKNMGIKLGTASLAAGLCILVLLCFRSRLKILWTTNAAPNHQKNLETCLRNYGSLAPQRYSYATIKKITNNFDNKIGEGGYSVVYKGKLSNGIYVAVKLLKQSEGNGEEFINEVVALGRTNHVNIARLIGFSFEGRKRALVFEFMSNGSLDKFSNHSYNDKVLPEETLFNIAVGIARGLEYLYRGCNTRILHFDIKPHNILLDEEFCPKISDFGLARLCLPKESNISMLEARGTIGYIAPEVFCKNFGRVSHKSDVYSYGMMILELVCGRINTTARTNDEDNSDLYFPNSIYNQFELEDNIVLEEKMSGEGKFLERKMILVSLWCIQAYPSNRPSITDVVEMLEGRVEPIPIPPKPSLHSPKGLASGSCNSPITVLSS